MSSFQQVGYTIFEPKSQPCDIYQLGRHRLMCGDSTIKDNIEKLMDDKADLLITDPPYNVNYQGGTKDKLKIQNDSIAAVPYLE